MDQNATYENWDDRETKRSLIKGDLPSQGPCDFKNELVRSADCRLGLRSRIVEVVVHAWNHTLSDR